MREPQDLPDGHPWAAFLGEVRKPGRYLGGEEQMIRKEPGPHLRCRFVLAFPDLYEIGMSHLGTRILYDLINRQEDLVCERAFSPWTDMEAQLRERGLPLVSLETYTPLRDFDVVGVSLQYELSYTNVLLNLDLGGIPLRTSERGDADPVVIAGGPTATHPEPIADFIDAFVVGEGEEVLPALLRTVGDMRRAGEPRTAILAALGRLPGVYVPSLYAVEEDPRTGLQFVAGPNDDGRAAGVPDRVERAFVRDLDAFPFPTEFPVPYAEAIFDRASVEITRGCTEGCRFCQAGIIYRPVRERSPKAVVDAILGGVDAAGFSETSLTALSTADVSCIDPLIKELVPELAKRKVKLGVASLRAYGLSEDLLDQIKSLGIGGLTFAPEAGTQRMRDVINKNVSEEDILTSARRIFERGYDRMKMYFIMGLPTETEEDVVGIVETGRRVRDVAKAIGLDRMPQVVVSVSQHVPKPHTPFQWAAMDTVDDLKSKVTLLRGLAKRAKLGLKTHDVEESWLECIFARGDRRLGNVLEHAYRAGARFDGWKECFSFDRWVDALEAFDIDPDRYTRTLPVDAKLPWDHVDIGLEPDFLAGEYRKALKSRLSPPCGKPFGDNVHHRTLEEAEAETRKLVCYDCGIACDMTQMREERIDALQDLRGMEGEREPVETEEPAGAAPALVPLERLAGRLAPSNLDDSSAFKHNAEAPHSRLRLTFSKGGTLRFLGHLDLLRVFPRVFRRARVELGYTRGYNPTPRITFGPALPLGYGADEEVVDVDVLLDRSFDDMTGDLSDTDRAALAADLLERLRAVTPPGMTMLSARLVAPGETKLGKLVGAAEYVVDLEGEERAALDSVLADRLAQTSLPVTRVVRPKKRNKKGKRGSAVPKEREVDVRPALMEARLDPDGGPLRFRLRMDPDGGARPREVVEAFLGERLPEHRFRRVCLLTEREGQWVNLGQLGPSFPPPRARSDRPRDAEAPTAC